jgi:hypothetical protein
MGTRTVQADSVSDADSESRHKECPLFISAGASSGGRLRRVVAGSLSQTVCRTDFLIPIGADFRNRNLPALYAYPITDSHSPVLVFLFLIWQIAGSNLGPEAVCPISSPSQVFLSPDFSTYFRCRCRKLLLYLMTHKVAHTIDRTPLDEGLARRTCTTQTKHKIRTSMPSAGFEPAIPVVE